jgi:hypothetical protein
MVLLGVRINEVKSYCFEARKWVRQHDPISPILFNYVANGFTIMLMKATRNGQLGGLLTYLVLQSSLACSMLMVL